MLWSYRKTQMRKCMQSLLQCLLVTMWGTSAIIIVVVVDLASIPLLASPPHSSRFTGVILRLSNRRKKKE